MSVVHSIRRSVAYIRQQSQPKQFKRLLVYLPVGCSTDSHRLAALTHRREASPPIRLGFVRGRHRDGLLRQIEALEARVQSLEAQTGVGQREVEGGIAI